MTASAAVVCALLLATGPSHRRRSPAARRSSALLLAESEPTSSSSLEFESPSALPVPRQPSRREFCALVSAAVAVGGAPRATSAAEVATAPPRKALRVAEEATIKLFEGTTASVVYIDTFVEQRDAFSTNVMEVPSGTGSGFVWDLDGHIVTNYHGKTARDARSSIFFWWRGDVLTRRTYRTARRPTAVARARPVVRGSPERAKIGLTGADGTQKSFSAKLTGFDADKDVAVLKVIHRVHAGVAEHEGCPLFVWYV